MTPTVPGSREEGATILLDVLAGACPGSDVRLIGSMAKAEGADPFSDIDIRWTIPVAEARSQLQSLRSTLQRVGGVESLRADPDSRPYRLVFARFHDWPLWWRVDLEIHSAGLGPMGVPDADPWSPYESACMGIVVTLKSLARNRPELAEGLWVRALRQADAVDVAGDWQLRIGALLDHIAIESPSTADVVARVRRLSQEVLSQ